LARFHHERCYDRAEWEGERRRAVLSDTLTEVVEELDLEENEELLVEEVSIDGLCGVY
jgi:mycofactocin precursor